MRLDVHQHLWTEPLIEALAHRDELPFVGTERGLTLVYLAGERPYAIDRVGEDPARRAGLVESDGLDRALVCLSSPIGIECLAREQALPLIEAYHEGALALGEPFGVWGALALDGMVPEDVDVALARGCVGLSLPAGALAGVGGIARVAPVLERLEGLGAPLFVHPGAGPSIVSDIPGRDPGPLLEPLWWPALTDYVAGMQAAWLSFHTGGRAAYPQLQVIFAMLAGLAPLHAERLAARGGPAGRAGDPLSFYETSSYGPVAVRAVENMVGASQLLYGSDRPVVDPEGPGTRRSAQWVVRAERGGAMLGARAQVSKR